MSVVWFAELAEPLPKHAAEGRTALPEHNTTYPGKGARVLWVHVVDQNGHYIPGATLQYLVDGALAQTIHVRDRPCRFEIDPPDIDVKFIALYEGRRREEVPASKSSDCRIQFEDVVIGPSEPTGFQASPSLIRKPDAPAKVLIVTALEKEGAAVFALLDDVDSLGAHGDPTIYNLGTIAHGSKLSQQRKVLLATQADIGKTNAAAITTNALRSFPSIEHVIMVGIAGGCPNPEKTAEHVRLGDIASCDYRGIIEYDDIKRTADGTEYRGSPQAPSQMMLQAASQLGIRAASGDRRWELHIAAALEKLSGYARPDDSLDVLYQEDKIVPHPNDPGRRKGWPRVHRGAIATADTLLKDPKLRDQLRDRFGARAVEMEGSGVQTAAWAKGKDIMVVRGICDYCDAHKNDVWQNYAALTAAAYARALIEILPDAWFP
jgi:nucleoside phosphorylase